VNEQGSTGGAHKLTVLLNYRKPKPHQNPYMSLFAESIAPEVNVQFFGWKTALVGTYDILHIHWPESMVRHSKSWQTAAAFVLAPILLLRLTVKRTPILWTRHNITPHEWRNRLEKWFVRALTKRVGLQIYLNESAENDLAGVTILHGDYSEWLAANNFTKQAQPQEILYFGLLRPYKGVEDLLRAFSACTDSDLTLRAAGQPSDPAYASELELLAETSRRTILAARYIEDAELTDYLSNAKLVALPYKSLYNSGSALLALSASIPVLLPRTPSTVSLQHEMGHEWVVLFDSPLSTDDLLNALKTTQSTSLMKAPMSNRAWSLIGALHGELYRLVVASRKKTGRRWPKVVREQVGELDSFTSHSKRNVNQTKGVKS
jgi:beta-1,4-mannosyltransferase